MTNATSWEVWGTGGGGSAYKPLYEVLIGRGLLPRHPPEEHLHPDEGSGYGGCMAVLVTLVELVILAILLAHRAP